MPTASRRALRWTALVVPLLWTLALAPVNAQSCPTSGAGTTCFGGQLYCASSGQCYNQPTCGSNQVMDCSACGCVCNTSLYPCGGCTAASSTTGASCSSPTGGQYANQCGTCACPSGTTLCPSSNSCIANRSCPAGTTWDPCSDTCGTPNVLLSPGFTQNGFINIAGDINERAGNLRLDYSPAAGQGDLYMANGKSLRVDGSGVTTLNVANFGSGGTGLNVNFPTGSQLCFGGACRNSWPSTADFNPTYVNAAGDTMTGDLNLTGASTDLFVAGNVGIGTTTPADGRLEIVRPSTSYRGNMIFGTGANNDWEIGELNTDGSFSMKRITSQPVSGAVDLFIDTADNVGIGTTTPGAKLDVSGAAKMSGFQMTSAPGAGKVLTSDASGVGTWQALPASVGGSGTAGTLAKFTAASTVGNSLVSESGSLVRVNGSLASGTGSNATGADAIAAGYYSQARGQNSVVMGFMNDADGQGAVSLGYQTHAPGFAGAAIGENVNAGGSSSSPYSVSIGSFSTASGNTSHTFGQFLTTSADHAFTIGTGALSTSTQMVNSVSGSIMMGVDSTIPTLTITKASGSGTVGKVGIGTTAPDRSLTVSNGTGANYVNVKDGTRELLMGVDSSGGIISVMTNHDLSFRAGSNSEKMRVTAGGNVGIGSTAPAARLSVGGNGTNVYATDVWVENNMHVQGNEAMAQGGGRGRLRIGTAWGYPGLYAETASNGTNTDLVLGASSDHVLINAGSFGRPGAGATLELYGSRLSDTGGGTLHIQSGGGVVAFDGGDTVVVNNGLQLGGVTRSSWPSLSVINTTATLYTWQGSGWKSISCPGGYGITGWSGYNCESNGGQWECSSAYLHSTYVDVWYSAEANAYVSINCAALN